MMKYWVKKAEKHTKIIMGLIKKKLSKKELEDKIFEQIGFYEHEIRSKRNEKSK